MEECRKQVKIKRTETRMKSQISQTTQIHPLDSIIKPKKNVGK